MLLYSFFLFLLSLVFPSGARTGDFAEWLSALRQEALAQGISSSTLDVAFNGVKSLPEVLEKETRQPEKTRTLAQYMLHRVSPERVAAGRSYLARHRKLLEEIGSRYGVQPRFIVALWGIESDFGRNMGQTPVIGALVTLAYAGRRRTYFRKELLVALRILEEGDIPLEQMEGSWAGAMGQCQFMPWNFTRRAVDYDGDGRRDIWHTPADVFASIAHFLAQLGWRDDLTWGREVRLPAGFDRALMGKEKDLGEWQALGIRRVDGRDLPKRHIPASLILPSRSGGKVFLVYDNFPLLLKWNNSTHFAIAVGHLADRLAR